MVKKHKNHSSNILRLDDIKGKTLLVTQVRSSIGCIQKQKQTLIALGLRKINSESTFVDANNSLVGMINSVIHLVKVKIT